MAELHTMSFRFNVQFENILVLTAKVRSSPVLQVQSSKFTALNFNLRHNLTQILDHKIYEIQNSLVWQCTTTI